MSSREEFHLRNKTCSPCLHSLVKTYAKFVRILEQVKNLEFSLICSRILPNVCLVFFNKIIIFRLNKGKDYIRNVYVHLTFFYETVNSHNLETESIISLTSFSCFIAQWKHTCRPIKTHVLSKLFDKRFWYKT